MLSYTFGGLLAGGMVGLSAGYLVLRDGGEDWGSHQWKQLGIWGGAGAGAGLLLGVSLGITDNGSTGPAAGSVVLGNILAGAVVGGVAGSVGGGFYSLAVNDSERAVYGAALGSLAGAGIGLITGLIQGPRLADQRAQARRVSPTFVSTTGHRNRPLLLLGATGRF